jgi:hypothetical protein
MTVVPKNIANFDQGAFIGINMIDGTLPKAPLHVRGSSNGSLPTNMRYLNYATHTGATNNWQGSTAIFVEGNICATEAFISAQSFTFSDKRLKKILGKSDSYEDLEKLKQIEVTRYKAADEIGAGDKILTKVVAQQVGTILPEAVAKTRGFLPDIMQVTSEIFPDNHLNRTTIELPEAHNLSAGNRVRLINDRGQELVASVVKIVSPSTFTIEGEISSTQKIFVYGKEVPDVQMVDYEAISMLNVSATQQLAKELDEARKEIEILKQQLKDIYQTVTK